MKADFLKEFCIQPLTLRFNSEQEKHFLEDHTQKSLILTRFGLALALVLYALFGILDYLLLPDVKEEIWFIRYAIGVPYLFFFLIFTGTSYYRKYSQPFLVLTVLIMGFGIIAMTIIAYPPGSYYYYAGLILVLMWNYTVTLRFLYATIAGWTVVAAYEIVAIGISRIPLPVQISNNFFFLSANLLGMVVCYLIEYYKRRDYCQRYLLEAEQKKSARLLDLLSQELVLASEVQKSLLPPPVLKWRGVEVLCYNKQSLEIGGDFYSYHAFEDGRFAMALGDVSGHGIPAALFMVTCLTEYHSTFTQNLTPCERLAFLDGALEPYTERSHQNCAFTYLELEHGSLYLANAGGVPPYIHRAGGEINRLKAIGFPLGHGFGKQYGYQGIQTETRAGDLIIMVSDGVVEAFGEDDEIFGFERLERTIAHGPNGTAQAMLDHLVEEVRAFSDKDAVQDDFTIAILKVGA
jgi:serine phosphatase RsbU (regulator of sigma subunit)